MVGEISAATRIKVFGAVRSLYRGPPKATRAGCSASWQPRWVATGSMLPGFWVDTDRQQAIVFPRADSSVTRRSDRR